MRIEKKFSLKTLFLTILVTVIFFAVFLKYVFAEEPMLLIEKVLPLRFIGCKTESEALSIVNEYEKLGIEAGEAKYKSLDGCQPYENFIIITSIIYETPFKRHYNEKSKKITVVSLITSYGKVFYSPLIGFRVGYGPEV